MAYVPEFKVDVFINYPMEVEDWADKFQQTLQDELRKVLPEKGVETYFARRDWKFGYPSDDMLDKARSAALFVALVIPASLSRDGSSSRFLHEEINAFRDSGSAVGRFCPIQLKPVSAEDLGRLMPLNSPTAFWKNVEFFYEENETPLTLQPNDEPFRKRVEMLAWHLKGRLEELRAKNKGAGKGETRGAFHGTTVLLAPKTSDIDGEWNQVRNLLVSDGVRVLPEGGYPAEDAEYSKLFDADLGSANLLVQLLSVELWSRTTDWERAKRQHELALSHSIPVLEWRKQGDPSDRMDNSDRAFFTGPNVLAGGLEEFKRILRKKLEATSKPSPQPAKRDKPYIYITADRPDMHIARQFQDIARKMADTDVMTEQKKMQRSDFEEALKVAAGVLFLYGDAKLPFVDGWLKEYMRKTRQLGVYPKLAALYYAPPKKTPENERPFARPSELREVGSQEVLMLEDFEHICMELSGERA